MTDNESTSKMLIIQIKKQKRDFSVKTNTHVHNKIYHINLYPNWKNMILQH
jgi:hypothetical protein